MAYRVIKRFVDLKNNNTVYLPGDTYPRAGATVSEARLVELSGTDNKRGIPLIEKIPEPAVEVVPVVESEPVAKPKAKSGRKTKK